MISEQVGTLTAKVDGEEFEISALVVTIKWVNSSIYDEVVTRCQMHGGQVDVKMDKKKFRRAVTKVKLQLLWFAIKNLFTK